MRIKDSAKLKTNVLVRQSRAHLHDSGSFFTACHRTQARKHTNMASFFPFSFVVSIQDFSRSVFFVFDDGI